MVENVTEKKANKIDLVLYSTEHTHLNLATHGSLERLSEDVILAIRTDFRR